MAFCHPIFNIHLYSLEKTEHRVLENVLIDEKVFIVDALNPGGWLIISGIIHQQDEKIIKEYSSLTIEQHEVLNEWHALLLRKNL